jgi:peptide methionine sulfoxide reductase MsrB
VLSDDEWKKLLPSDVYYVARQKGTERPNTSEYEKSNEIGTYYCAVAVMLYLKVIQNLKAVVVGQVFMTTSARFYYLCTGQ